MLSANTPFKIHDENSTAGLQSVNKKNASKARQGPTTGGKIFGVAEDSFTPMKFGKDITATTTSKPRRALGEVSHNQLNQTAQKMASTPFQQIIKASTMKTTMKAGPGTMNIENAATVGSVQKVKFNLEPTIDDDEIVCSRKGDYSNDAYDIVQKKVAKILEDPEKHSIFYNLSESSFAEDEASKTGNDFDFEFDTVAICDLDSFTCVSFEDGTEGNNYILPTLDL